VEESNDDFDTYAVCGESEERVLGVRHGHDGLSVRQLVGVSLIEVRCFQAGSIARTCSL
jgi:hypothetical protein